MKLVSLSFVAAIAASFLVGCASDFDPNAGGSYADPDPLSTQGRIQDMHSDAMRQQF